MRSLSIFLLFSLYLPAGPSGFDGRWDITAPDSARKRAWWLEVKGAETSSPSGSFVGAPGGQVDKLTDLKVENGELRFSFERRYKGQQAPPSTGVYRARLVNGKLEGTFEVDGVTSKWHGVRAPKWKPVDISKLRKGKPVELFNGRDLNGWRPLREGSKIDWEVVDGITRNAPRATDLVTEQKFWNYNLHAEYRIGPKSNSGIGLRGRYEIQIYEDHGRPASDHGNGALYNRIAPLKNSSKPAGEWQTLDITLIENRLTVTLNGTKVHDNVEVEGLTAIAMDPNEAEPGPIVVQGDHGVVEFRKLTLTPLVN